jgi:hypothetical protein
MTKIHTAIMAVASAMIGLTAIAIIVGSITTPTLEQLRPIARPDLALEVMDLPAGYSPAMPDYAAGNPLSLRVLRRTTPGAGPAMIWSAAFDAGNPELAVQALEHPEYITALLGPGMAQRLTEWDEIEAVESGDRHAHVYRFRYDGPDADGTATGILLLSERDRLVTYLALFGPEEQTRAALPAYAQMAEARLAAAGSLARR